MAIMFLSVSSRLFFPSFFQCLPVDWIFYFIFIHKTGWINKISSKFQVATIFQQWPGSTWSCEWSNVHKANIVKLVYFWKVSTLCHLDFFTCFSLVESISMLVRFWKFLNCYVMIQIFFSLLYMYFGSLFCFWDMNIQGLRILEQLSVFLCCIRTDTWA